MNFKKPTICFLNFLAFAILLVSMAYAAATYPSAPTSMGTPSNTTKTYPNGSLQNLTRGYIYTVDMVQSQPTQKWIGFVGNIQGKYALQDANGSALYDWDIATVVGEVYATKEGPYQDRETVYDDANAFAGGIPAWDSLKCAIQGMIERENAVYNHSLAEEDSYIYTFTNTVANFTVPSFRAGETPINDSFMYNSSGTQRCYGAQLNINGASQNAGTNWSMIVLTDGTSQYRTSAKDEITFDLLYAGMIRNNAVGFNGQTYDYQLLLPESGLQGTQPNVGYYFYVELM